jgi:hypothetical protein
MKYRKGEIEFDTFLTERELIDSAMPYDVALIYNGNNNFQDVKRENYPNMNKRLFEFYHQLWVDIGAEIKKKIDDMINEGKVNIRVTYSEMAYFIKYEL